MSLDLAFAKGLISGTHWAMALLRPLSMAPRPRNPYWCPAKWWVWRISFMIGVHQVLQSKKDT